MSPTMLLIFMPSINPNTDGCLMMIATGNVFIAHFVFLFTWEQDPGDHSGEHNEKQGCKLQVSG